MTEGKRATGTPPVPSTSTASQVMEGSDCLPAKGILLATQASDSTTEEEGENPGL